MRRRNLAMRSRDGCKRGLIGGPKWKFRDKRAMLRVLPHFVQSGIPVALSAGVEASGLTDAVPSDRAAGTSLP
jgi:hypothetical protein